MCLGLVRLFYVYYGRSLQSLVGLVGIVGQFKVHSIVSFDTPARPTSGPVRKNEPPSVNIHAGDVNVFAKLSVSFF